MMRDASAGRSKVAAQPWRPALLGTPALNFERWNRLNEMGLPHAQEQFFEMMPWHVRWGMAQSRFCSGAGPVAVGIFAANLIGRG
jgi:hypothetical protein